MVINVQKSTNNITYFFRKQPCVLCF